MTGSTIPKKLREDMAADPFYHRCARQEALHDHVCVRDPINPRKPVEWEHALYRAGKKLQERFAIVPLCWWAHRGPGLSKRINEWIALSRATKDQLLELSALGGKDYMRYLSYLEISFGIYYVDNSGENHVGKLEINYGYPVQ
jgi:hypothetical protein